MSTTGRHAVVIGSSMAGLLAARVLSQYFDRVTVIERDRIGDGPLARKGQPQARHLHVLLAQGFQILTRYFPDLPQALSDGGAVLVDMTEHMRWYTYGGYRTRFTFGSRNCYVSRPFLEWTIRQRIMALPNVSMCDGWAVEKLLTNENHSRVTGVHLEQREQAAQDIQADLVLDASGRGSQTPKWLQSFGYARPEEETVRCGVGYATRIFRRDTSAADSQDWTFVTGEPPQQRRGGGAFPVEGDRWIVTLGGYHGDHPPDSEAGFLEFARNLPTDDVYRVISQCEPLSDIVLHKFPNSQRRRYERLERFPEGLLVFGDALCSFNPLYGQGMTVATLEATALDALLRERSGNVAGIAPEFFRRMARVLDVPWRMAIGEDFRFPETEGRKPPGTDVLNTYVAMIHHASQHDTSVCRAFVSVMNLLQPPASLFRPGIMWRVLRANFVRRKTS
ncbi:MAG TPA: hypothetical protein VFT99_13230, partial [Roseiflexaceae bacterium]|nr:hypothetical protein [Roseiflexaceae bacterium]